VAERTRREQQAQERRAQLIETALKLFAERGMERTTTKDIADAAGVAPGLLYHYFRSKDDVFWAIVERYNPQPELSRILASASERPAAEVLTRAATRAYELLAERRDLVRLILREAFTRPELQQQLRALQHTGIRILTSFLAARIEAGELRPHDPEVSARMLGGSVAALLLTGLPAEPSISRMVTTLMQGIAVAGRA
jgi:AcrR family transcriptional regulator